MKTLFVSAVYILFIVIVNHAQTPIDISKFARESQRYSKKDGSNVLVWWIPAEYWRVSAQSKPDIAEAMQEAENALSSYVVIGVADAFVQGGKIASADKSNVRERLSIVDKTGETHTPLQEADVSGVALEIVRLFKPVLDQIMGDVGMHMFFFNVRDTNNQPLIDAAKEGTFKVVLNERDEFTWTTPLPSLMPAKYCPVDKERMKGNWKFCPIHGKKL
jgi:hypothetical protein